VDVEYNRQIDDPKRVGDGEGWVVVPDLIIHRRGEPQNYFVLEMKVGKSTEPDAADVENLQAIQDTHGYRYGAFLRLAPMPLGVACLHWMRANESS
jgi:hypothetical protein